MNAPLELNAKATPLPNDLGQRIEALRADLMKISARISDDMSEGIEKAAHQVGRAGRDARATASNAVSRHPLTAVGIAAGVGLVLGMMARKG